ncbi:TolC family protein [Pedobacter heparinus]|uniref:TolC family protein n=1 Tax=Pedobacter heparinus TaxID=984 RepID=UPI002931C2C8|nr:TolC family protein [Pedobacter heparinus]
MKNVSLLIIVLMCAFGFKSSAQESILAEINYSTLEKYIQAAKENLIKRQILGLNAEKAKADIPITTLGYLDMVGASYFWRPQSKSAIDANNPYIVNGFQLGINVSLGSLLQRPFLIKKAKIDYKIAQLEMKDYDRTLANEVKARYYDYIQQLNQLKINSQVVQDGKNVAENLKYKFEKGEVTLDVYNQSRVALAGANSSKIESEVSYLKTKDALEEIIGKKLEEIK